MLTSSPRVASVSTAAEEIEQPGSDECDHDQHADQRNVQPLHNRRVLAVLTWLRATVQKT